MTNKKVITGFKKIQLQYTVSGSGNTVLLLHGFGEDGSIWNEIGVALSKQYKVIIPDVPGSGGSPMINEGNVTMEDYAECIYEILRKENISHCAMAGHSMGGYITLAFANKYPAMLSAIALIHSTAYADSEEKKATRKKAIQFISENGSEAFLKTAIPDLFANKTISAKDIAMLIQSGKSITPETLMQYYQAMMQRPSTIDVLKQTPLPILFIAGEHDKAVPLQHVLEQCHLPGNAMIHILRESGHMGMLEEPNKTLDIFTHFLQGIYV